MSEDRTAAAALAIERYIAGLREELALLGTAESGELAREIRDMLTDAAREDAELAFAEMERLGEPAELAATLLAERGVSASAGIPTAAWWRLGTAAVLDIIVGVAAPLLIAVGSWSLVPLALDSLWPQGIVVLIAIVGALGLTLSLSWQYWLPWREGGRATTPGMALAGIAVLRIGDTRTVASISDLRRAGLALPTVKATSPGVIASVLLAVLFVIWAFSAASGGALDPSGSGVVARYAGSADNQKDMIRQFVEQLYEAASGVGADWPAVSERDFTTPPHLSPTATLSARFSGTDVNGGVGYSIVSMVTEAPGVWTVKVAEAPAHGSARTVFLTYVLRIEWARFATGERPRTDWVLTDYVVK